MINDQPNALPPDDDALIDPCYTLMELVRSSHMGYSNMALRKDTPTRFSLLYLKHSVSDFRSLRTLEAIEFPVVF